MKKLMCIIRFSWMLIPGITTGSLMAQTNNQMVEMVKNVIQQFDAFQAEEVGSEEFVVEGSYFDPNSPLYDRTVYTDILKKPEKMFSLSEYQNYYTVLDEKEVPINNIDLVLNYSSLPGFTAINAWYETGKLTDAKGKNLLLPEKEIEKYREMGIIEDDFNIPVPGEYSMKQWLIRELEYGEELKIQGTIGMEYPSEYQSAVFDKNASGSSKTIENMTIELVEIDRNMVTLIFKGNRKEIEQLQTIILNEEGKMFASTSSMAIDLASYDVEKKSVKQLSDKEIAESVESFDVSNMEVQQVKKTKVYGNIAQVVFIKIQSLEYLEMPFTISLPLEY